MTGRQKRHGRFLEHCGSILEPIRENSRLYLLDKAGLGQDGGRQAQLRLINHEPGNGRQAPLPR